ncbi:MAG TPA: 50S ribosomal protein L11 methyltransferase [Gemmatimonadaceae bacterium]|nr:50S ribosomal protein L11 methyltransferase [Gemmatimonadaceae bacterium]
MSWLAVRVSAGPNREAALAALFELGSLGVEEVGEELVTHFPDDVGADDVIGAVQRAAPGSTVATSRIAAVDWTEEWKKGVGAHDLGALSIVPPWLAEGRDPSRVVIIEPEMAFGTGEHETTRGVVRLLAATIRAGDRVADLGAGSAVLAIAAAKLGAGQVAAIEIDHDAIANAVENVARNGVSGRVTVLEGDAAVLLPLVAPVRVVLANILSSVLLELLPAIRESLTADGEAILSGILVDERESMLAALAHGDWRVVAEDVEGSWWTARVARS